MKYLIERSSDKLLFVTLIFVLIGFIVVGMDTKVVASSHVEQSKAAQEDAATAIANACASLISSCARNPVLCAFGSSTTTTLLDYYDDFVNDIMSLKLNPNITDLALAKSIIEASLIGSVAQNPGLKTDLEGLAANCNNDIESIGSHKK